MKFSKSPQTSEESHHHRASLKYSLLQRWALDHYRALLECLNRVSQTRFATFLTVSVIGISLALPVGLFGFLKNIEVLGRAWDSNTHISLFLQVGTNEETVHHILKTLKSEPDISAVSYISPEEGLKEFSQVSGLNTTLTSLEENPLPGVIQVTPSLSINSKESLNTLLNTLKNLPHVEVAQLDLDWLNRLFAFVEIAKRFVFSLGLLLALGVLLVISNTIRLSVYHYREAIEVLKLVGAADGFVRRPFLYTGVVYGLAGAMIALLVDDTIIAFLRGPITHFAELYHSEYTLGFMSPETALMVIGVGLFLGLAGSWVAVGRHLSAVQPR